MKKTIASLALSTVLGCFPVPSQAQDVLYTETLRGTDLLTICNEALRRPITDKVSATWCYGIINGVSGSVAYAYALTEQQDVCIPTGTTAQAELRIVVSYLRSHEEMLQYGAAALARRALTEAFPCQPAAR